MEIVGPQLREDQELALQANECLLPSPDRGEGRGAGGGARPSRPLSRHRLQLAPNTVDFLFCNITSWNAVSLSFAQEVKPICDGFFFLRASYAHRFL
eukprot:4666541-Pyramimonas_sp.AAC.1